MSAATIKGTKSPLKRNAGDTTANRDVKDYVKVESRWVKEGGGACPPGKGREFEERSVYSIDTVLEDGQDTDAPVNLVCATTDSGPEHRDSQGFKLFPERRVRDMPGIKQLVGGHRSSEPWN